MQPEWLINEAERRADLLRKEVEFRFKQARDNRDSEQWRLHYSQMMSINIMMRVFFERQQHKLAVLRSSGDTVEPTYQELLAEITGAQGLWRVFQYIFDQRTNQRVKKLLDVADLVAYDCYTPCISLARSWGLFELEFREPPLTYLDAVYSPLAVVRSSEVQALGMAVGRYRNQQLPVPITVLPVDHITSIWLFSALAHEVGHHLDRDLRQKGSPMLSEELNRLLLDQVLPQSGQQRWDDWSRWCAEILADALGILLSGAGFAYTMASFLLPLTGIPNRQGATTHPPSRLRLVLLCAMLRQLQSDAHFLAEATNWITDLTASLPLPPAGYIDDGERVIHALFEHQFNALGGRQLVMLAPTLSEDLARTDQLVAALLEQEPEPEPLTFPYRLVPSAAQIALARLSNPEPESLQSLHDRALAFFKRIPEPETALDGGLSPSDDHIRELAGQIHFSFDLE